MTRAEIVADIRKKRDGVSTTPRFSTPLDQAKPRFSEPLDRWIVWWVPAAKETDTQVQPEVKRNIYTDTNPRNNNNLLGAAEAWLATSKGELDINAQALKEWIVEANTWKGFLALWAANAWAGTPIWQSVWALRLLNSNVRERLAGVDASKWDRLAQLESNYQTLRSSIISNKETQDANKEIQTRQLDQQDSQIRLQKAQLVSQLRAAWMKDSEIFNIIK